MSVPTWAGFVADFPDDQVEHGLEIEVFGGRNVAVALRKIFVGLGCNSISEPTAVGDQGWAFEADDGDHHRFWCRVQSFHPVFWLLLEGRPDSRTGAAAHVELWRKFGSALERDPRFHKILWRSFKDGPPDWDEVEAAPDPPERSFEEEFPPSEIRAGRVRPKIWPYIVGVWLMFSGVTAPFAMAEGAKFPELIGYAVGGVLMFLVGALFFLQGLHLTREASMASRRSSQKQR